MINWQHWHNEPYLVGGLVMAGWLYALAMGPFRAFLGGPPQSPGEASCRWCFFSGLAVFYLAVGSPLDQIGEQFLFSAHMLQHLLLVYPAAALVHLGMPAWLLDGVIERGRLSWFLRIATRAPVALVGYSVLTGVWHFPDLYDWALRDKTVHVMEHLSFFAAALFLWWPVLSRSSRFPAIPPGAQILYWLGMMILATPLFAYITFSRDILYPTYEYAPRILPLSAKEDQVLAGVMMKISGMCLAIGMSGLAFWKWFRRDGD